MIGTFDIKESNSRKYFQNIKYGAAANWFTKTINGNNINIYIPQNHLCMLLQGETF